jgi:hypothetical protein
MTWISSSQSTRGVQADGPLIAFDGRTPTELRSPAIDRRTEERDCAKSDQGKMGQCQSYAKEQGRKQTIFVKNASPKKYLDRNGK